MENRPNIEESNRFEPCTAHQLSEPILAIAPVAQADLLPPPVATQEFRPLSSPKVTKAELSKIVRLRHQAMHACDGAGDAVLYSELVESHLPRLIEDLKQRQKAERMTPPECAAVVAVFSYLEEEQRHHAANPSPDHIWHQIDIVRRLLLRLTGGEA